MVSVEEIARAAAVLRAGGVVAFPTETVYGLGADASNAAAIGKIYALKGRPSTHPVIVHLARSAQLADWARAIPPLARKLAQCFWPGPLTLILRRAGHVLDAVTGGQDTVAIRVPAHPVAQALLQAFGGGVAAPSANRFGRVSATSAAHVRAEFGAALDLLLDGGECAVGIESTIVDVSGPQPVLLRPGGIGVLELEAVLGVGLASGSAASPRAPGTLKAHYAPSTPLMLVDSDMVPELVRSLDRQDKKLAVLSFSIMRPLLPGLVWLAAPADPAGYAHGLYANLRELDAAGCDIIIVERPPECAQWLAVLDRLTRAAAGSSAADIP
ncbi:MAG: threonylcarbamoyl-AMP synthase [Betaproteobacteria bacterium]|nr:MAG: threonylcarbamoyl-AMP synthase [Betaproteobacteria bacterium]